MGNKGGWVKVEAIMAGEKVTEIQVPDGNVQDHTVDIKQAGEQSEI